MEENTRTCYICKESKPHTPEHFTSDRGKLSDRCVECRKAYCRQWHFNRRGEPKYTRHHKKDTPEYHTWNGMLERCRNPRSRHYGRYGARGITVCERWAKSFPYFYEDMGAKPSPAHSLDRIDNNGPYSPENCRWATKQEQSNNRRNNRQLTVDSITQTASQWSDNAGMERSTLFARLARGWTPENAVRVPVQPVRTSKRNALYTFHGETGTVRWWASRVGLNYALLRERLHRGWTLERALTTPRGTYPNGKRH